uniref:Death associated protein like 1 n=3 Tax=Thraupidae TaxID=400783 RepID=A0A8C3MP08_GEOPR
PLPASLTTPQAAPYPSRRPSHRSLPLSPALTPLRLSHLPSERFPPLTVGFVPPLTPLPALRTPPRPTPSAPIRRRRSRSGRCAVSCEVPWSCLGLPRLVPGAPGSAMALRKSVPPGRRPPAVKAGGMRVSKKQENGPVEKNAKLPGKEKSSAIVSFAKPQNMGVLVAEALNKMSHKIHAATLQVAHQKPQPTLEKFILPKRIYIIQQPRKC